MADLSQTITNTLGLFGPAATNKWGTIVWGTDKWGYGNVDLETSVDKLITGSLSVSSEISRKDVEKIITNTQTLTSEQIKEIDKILTNTQTLTSAVLKDIEKIITAGTVTLTDSMLNTFDKLLGLTLTLTEDIYQTTLRDAAGYYYIFQGNTTNAHDRASGTVTDDSAGSTSWSTVSSVTTPWS